MTKKDLFINGLVVAGLFFQARDSLAMGNKPQHDASYYISGMEQDGAADSTVPAAVRLPSKMATGCSPAEKAIVFRAKGIYFQEDGKFYGYEDYPQIDRMNPYFYTLLKTDAAAAKNLFDYAEKIGFSGIKFDSYPEGADFCFVTYSVNGTENTVKWAKDPLLREMTPPPADAVKLFDAVKEAVGG